MKILITGGSGFVGRNLAEHFSLLGHEIVILTRNIAYNQKNLKLNHSVSVINYSAEDDIKSALHAVQPDVIIHAACAYGRSGESYLDMLDGNVRFGLIVAESAANLNKAITFVNIGTSLPSKTNAYSISKAQLQDWLELIQEKSPGFNVVNIKLEYVYGPGDDPSKFVMQLIKSFKENKPSYSLTGGEQCRDFIYINDVISAFDCIIKNLAGISKMEDIGLGTGVAVKLSDFIKSLHEETGSRTVLKFGEIPYAKSEVMYTKANLTILSALGWKPEFTYREGVRLMVKALSDL